MVLFAFVIDLLVSSRWVLINHLGIAQMDHVPAFKGRKLVILRLLAITMLIAMANQAYIGYTTEIIIVGTRRYSFVIPSDYLWLGFLFLAVSSAVAILFIFINHHATQAFKTLSKIFGGAWFLVFAGCYLVDITTR